MKELLSQTNLRLRMKIRSCSGVRCVSYDRSWSRSLSHGRVWIWNTPRRRDERVVESDLAGSAS